MLRLPPARRVFAALFAPWFAVVTAEPAAVHECAMHSPMAAHAAAGAVADAEAQAAPHAMVHDHAAMMHHHDGAPDDGAPAGAMAGQGAPAGPRHAAHQCTCPDGCCAASPVAVRTEAPLSWVPAFVHRAPQPRRMALAPLADADHVLPFANGPPARS